MHTYVSLHLLSPFLLLLDILADLPLKALAPLLQLFDGAVLWKLIGGAAHLTLSQAAGEQLLRTESNSVNTIMTATHKDTHIHYVNK